MRAPYIGNGPYCYANTVAVLLASHGFAVPAELIECLTGVGIGARWWLAEREIYFSLVPPDVGVSRALERLGFSVTERSGNAGDPPPFDALREALEQGPVALGPLDMGHLTYHPNASGCAGADHFVLLTALGDDHARLHDPNGYANVRITLDDLGQAWEAGRIAYRREPYRSWALPRRVHVPGDETLRAATLAACRDSYAAADAVPADRGLSGPDAFAAAAEHLRAGAAGGLLGLLTAFGLPLGARRAQDLSLFPQSADRQLAEIKRHQSEAFIDGYRHALAKDPTATADSLLAIGALDEAFCERLTELG